MNCFTRWFYKLTAAYPRHLPTTVQEYDHLKWVFKEAYDVPESNAAWATIASHLGSVPSQKVRVSWGKVSNAAKRLTINKLIQEQKVEAIRLLQEDFEKLKQEHLSAQDAEEKKELINDVS